MPASLRYDWLMVALCAWFQVGAYLDAWAHVHLTELESFFTPWHGVLYSGFFAVAALTAAPLLRRRAPGRAWNEALPAGYDLSLVGVLAFLLGGVLDMIWHIGGVVITPRKLETAPRQSMPFGGRMTRPDATACRVC